MKYLISIVICILAIGFQGLASAQEHSLNDDGIQITNFPAVYQNVLDVEKYFVVIYRPSIGTSIVSYSGPNGFRKYVADTVLPGEREKSLKLFIPDGPIKFYIPNFSLSSQSERTWEYEGCHFEITQIRTVEGNLLFSLDEFDDEEYAQLMIESFCEQSHNRATRYLLDAREGLLAFTLGEITPCDNQKKCFIPEESYFLHEGELLTK